MQKFVIITSNSDREFCKIVHFKHFCEHQSFTCSKKESYARPTWIFVVQMYIHMCVYTYMGRCAVNEI
jgi:hypothetical protein